MSEKLLQCPATSCNTEYAGCVTYCDTKCDGASCVIAGVLSKDVGISFISAHITAVKVALSNGN